MPDISIVIVSYNDKKNIFNCIQSIAENASGVAYEVIIVKNDFEALDLRAIQNIEGKTAIIQNRENLGFGKAVNIGIQKSSAKYVMLLNSDTVVRPRTIEDMFEYMEGNQKVALCGPRLLNADGSLQLSCKAALRPPRVMLRDGFLNMVWPPNRITDKHLIDKKAHAYTHEVDCVKGACLFVRRKAIDEVGLMDEQFFIFGEEFDWCRRMKTAGWKIMYLAGPALVHYGGGSSKKEDDDKLAFDCALEHFKSLFKLYRKYYGKSGVLSYKLLAIFEFSLKTFAAALKGSGFKRHMRLLCAIFKLEN